MVKVVAVVVAQGINKVTVTIMSPAVITVFVKDVAKAILKAIDIRAVQRAFCSIRLADVNGSPSGEISSLVARICAVGEWSLPARHRPFGATVGRSPTRSGEVGTWSCRRQPKVAWCLSLSAEP